MAANETEQPNGLRSKRLNQKSRAVTRLETGLAPSSNPCLPATSLSQTTTYGHRVSLSHPCLSATIAFQDFNLRSRLLPSPIFLHLRFLNSARRPNADPWFLRLVRERRRLMPEPV